MGGLLLAAPAAPAQDQPDLSKIPPRVMDALKSRFPAAEIHQWSTEREGGLVLYDIEFQQGGRKFEADIRQDGTIHNWEQQIAVTDLPATVPQAVERRYPGATLKEIMRVTAVRDGKGELEGYEILLETADGKEIEVMLAPDGSILEDAGEA